MKATKVTPIREPEYTRAMFVRALLSIAKFRDDTCQDIHIDTITDVVILQNPEIYWNRKARKGRWKSIYDSVCGSVTDSLPSGFVTRPRKGYVRLGR